MELGGCSDSPTSNRGVSQGRIELGQGGRPSSILLQAGYHISRFGVIYQRATNKRSGVLLWTFHFLRAAALMMAYQNISIHSNSQYSLESSWVRGEEHCTIIAPATLLPKHIRVANCTADHLFRDKMQYFFFLIHRHLQGQHHYNIASTSDHTWVRLNLQQLQAAIQHYYTKRLAPATHKL